MSAVRSRPAGIGPGNVIALAWRQMRRDLKAGDVRILLAALVLAVLAVTAVGFVTDRAERALTLQANQLLGGDAVVRGDAPIGAEVERAAAGAANAGAKIDDRSLRDATRRERDP